MVEEIKEVLSAFQINPKHAGYLLPHDYTFI
jgi:hypothetical protein